MLQSKFSNNIIDILTSDGATYKSWGGQPNPTSMGDGVKFRVSKSTYVDYVYVRYLSGHRSYEVEFAALVGLDYDVIDRVAPVSAKDLMRTITEKLN